MSGNFIQFPWLSPQEDRFEMPIQEVAALDDFYVVEDPWNYDATQADLTRVARLLAALPSRSYRRVLDIGCGNGFLTLQLPGAEIMGVDVSPRAVEWARKRAATRPDAERFIFEPCSIFDLDPARHGRFDLMIITGVLYPQYIGEGAALIRMVIDRLLEDGGILASVHIDDWCSWRFPYTLVYADLSPYRQYVHRLEIFEK
jgi:SAM-dependent methyltransferase